MNVGLCIRRLARAGLLAGAAALVSAPAGAAVTAGVVGNQLQVNGDGANDIITLRLLAGDTTQVEVLDDAVVVGTFPRAGFTTIVVNGGDGADTILVSDANGAFTNVQVTTLNGGEGNDTITGGAGGETLNGGNGNDTLTGGPGVDPHLGGPGDDLMIWNPGDGSEPVDGEAGNDTFQFNGGSGVDTMTISPNGQRVTFFRNPGAITMNIGTTENLLATPLAGNDTVTGSAGLAGLIAITIDGGEGDDILTGGDGNDVILGGAGNDTLNGAAGNDTLTGGPGVDPHLGGPGDDLMIWNPGDGSEPVDGEAGNDTFQFNGGSGVDTMTISPNGQRVTFFRDPGAITIDIGTTENLLATPLGGNDTVTGSAGLAGLINITIDGGDGDDTLTGGDGNDVIRGGAGFDTLSGGAGNDTLIGGPGAPGFEPHLGGPGDDLMIWNPGDGNDLNEGGDGNDTLQFNGSGGAEIMSATANGQRVTFLRNLGNINMDVGSTENLLVFALGGDDALTAGPGLAGLIALAFDGGAGADTFNTSASTNLTALGGTEVDTLNFDAQGQAASVDASTITIGGQARVTHSLIENINVLNGPSAVPTIQITSPTADPATTAAAPFITLAGTAADETGITSITWTSDRGASGAATGTTNWIAADIPLLSGVNVITVTVQDTSGNRVSDTIAVTVTVFTYTLAEGATGSFFDLDVLVANPNAAPAPIVAQFLRENGTSVTRNFTVAPRSQLVIDVEDIPGLEATAVSTVITSTSALPLSVERTMFWDQDRYGSHGGTAVEGPRLKWYFAEGSEGFFSTFVLLANTSASPAAVTLSFLPESGAPVVKTFTVAPTSRLSVATSTIPELRNRSFSIVVDSNVPIVAERAMYFTIGRFWEGGHEAAGVADLSRTWFLAEGATGPFFETFVLVGNPNPTPAAVTLTFLTDGGTTVTRNYQVGANSRLTVNIEVEDPALANAAVSTTVTSDVPVVAERAMYWPGAPSQWQEAHNSFGATGVGTRWALAEGRVGTAQGFDTYILLANASETQAAQVRITFLRANGTTVVKTFTVNATSRRNVHVNTDAPELQNETFGALIEVTSGAGIFVERALYSNSGGVVWAAGTNALATRLP
jgi:Ca2+-binding RTX toxin-like protein